MHHPTPQAFTSEGKEVWETHLQSQIHTVSSWLASLAWRARLMYLRTWHRS